VEPHEPSAWVVRLSFALAIIGLGFATYLTYAHFTSVNALICSDKGSVNCAKVTTSSQSEIFGVLPVAVIGLAYFAGMVALCSPWAWRPSRLFDLARLAGVISGVGMVFYLVYAELFQIDALCIYCTAVHIVTVLLFIVVMSEYVARPASTRSR
jgi:uncharacterized membrane protein